MVAIETRDGGWKEPGSVQQQQQAEQVLMTCCCCTVSSHTLGPSLIATSPCSLAAADRAANQCVQAARGAAGAVRAAAGREWRGLS